MKNDAMKPGDVRTFKKGTGQAVVLMIRIPSDSTVRSSVNCAVCLLQTSAGHSAMKVRKPKGPKKTLDKLLSL